LYLLWRGKESGKVVAALLCCAFTVIKDFLSLSGFGAAQQRRYNATKEEEDFLRGIC